MTNDIIVDMRQLYKIFVFFVCVACCSGASAQVRTIKFTGRDQTSQCHIPLSHVNVFNLDQLWEEVLYYPDTTLILGAVGIDDYGQNQDVQLMQNVPNPFDGTTEFALLLPEDRDVLLEIYDITGRLVVGQRFKALSAGTHLFQATLSSPQIYLLSAKVDNGQMTIKMVNEGLGTGNSIRHLGMTDKNGDFTIYLKDDKSYSRYPFNVGDEMKYTGYAIIDGTMQESNIVLRRQYNSETILLMFNVAVPTVTITAIGNVTSSSAFYRGNVTSAGSSPVTARGVCWSTTQTPTIAGNHTTNSGGTGAFTGYITGLSPSTTYYVRAYATNSVGTAYGEQKTITTSPTLPTVTTNNVTNIATTSATCGGQVTFNGGATVIARGVCWSTSQYPTDADNHTTNGTGIGSYTSNITGLIPNTTYYVRAYATNSAGTAYGEQKSFTTPCNSFTVYTSGNTNINYGQGTTLYVSGANSYQWSTNDTAASITVSPTTTTTYAVTGTNSYGCTATTSVTVTVNPIVPTVITNNVTNTDTNSATCGGNVTSDGGATVIARGVCWSALQSPTVTDSYTSDGTGTGSFASSITGLVPNTTYYVRSYATNSAGTAYGEEKSFTTSCNSFTVNISGNSTINCRQSTTLTASGASSYHWSTNVNTASITVSPTATTTYSVTGTNNYGCTATASRTVTVNPVIPMVTTNNVTNIATTSATCGGNVTSDGCAAVTARGVCWSTSPSPTISGSHTTDGSGTGSFASSITGLVPNTTYYVRSYATNSAGTAYGEEKSFTTSCNSFTVNISGSSTINCRQSTTLTASGASSYHWSTNVTTASITVSPTATTAYSVTGTNNYGCTATASRTVTVNPVIPTVTTNNVTNISTTSATCGGNVTSDGCAAVTARGVCWSTSPSPTISGSHTTNGTGTGNFASSITGLTPNTTYYVRSYATNSAGTAYGEEKSFTTSCNSFTVNISGNSTINCRQSTTLTASGASSYRWSTNTFTASITVIPTITTTYNVTGTNSYGCTATASRTVTVNPLIPTVTTNNVTNIAPTSATCGGNVTSDGCAAVTARGVCWSTSPSPTISGSHTSDGTGTGSFASSITGLTPNTTYYVRSYATNSAGTAYGEEKSFTTSCNSFTVNISGNTTLNCGQSTTLTASGASSYRWSTNTFTASITVTPTITTTYNVTGTNNYGCTATASRTVTVNPVIPTVTTNNVTNIATNSATCGGNVTSDGCAAVTARGVCWSTSPSPTISGSHTSDGTGTGSFTSGITGLTPNTTYYVRAYATNSAGTAYGAQKSFTTGTINDSFTVTACDGYTWNGQTYTTSGDYVQHFTSATGFDSTVTLHLTIIYSNMVQVDTFVCDRFTWNNHTYYASGDYVQHFQNIHGCDSTVILHVTVGESFYTEYTDTVCDRYNWTGYTWNGQTYYTSGDYVQYFTSANGCDSTVTLHLAVNYFSETGFSVTVCDRYIWNGQTYTTSIVDEQHFLNKYGCDSTVTLHLTVHYSDSTEHSVTVCDSYTWNNQTYYTSGDYVQYFTASNGCDSTVTLHLTVNYSKDTAWAQTVCDSYTWNGQVYDTTGNYIQHFQTIHGCDSTVTMYLTILHSDTVYMDSTVCASSLPIVWNGKTFTDAGTQTAFYENSEHCDSVVVMTLHVSSCGPVIDSKSCPAAPTVTDHDGNVYATVQIGNQCWMRENMRTTHYADGTYIAQGSENSTTIGYWYYPNHDSTNKQVYGLLYNWAAVMHGASSSNTNPSGVQGVCPEGWHVPSDTEWVQLIEFVRTQTVYGCNDTAWNNAKAMSSTFGWNSSTMECTVGNAPNTNNATGFSIVPAGCSIIGYGSRFGEAAYLWSATENGENETFGSYMDLNILFLPIVTNLYKRAGLSVRCLRDENNISENTVPVLTGNVDTVLPVRVLNNDCKDNLPARSVLLSSLHNHFNIHSACGSTIPDSLIRFYIGNTEVALANGNPVAAEQDIFANTDEVHVTVRVEDECHNITPNDAKIHVITLFKPAAFNIAHGATLTPDYEVCNYDTVVVVFDANMIYNGFSPYQYSWNQNPKPDECGIIHLTDTSIRVHALVGGANYTSTQFIMNITDKYGCKASDTSNAIHFFPVPTVNLVEDPRNDDYAHAEPVVVCPTFGHFLIEAQATDNLPLSYDHTLTYVWSGEAIDYTSRDEHSFIAVNENICHRIYTAYATVTNTMGCITVANYSIEAVDTEAPVLSVDLTTDTIPVNAPNCKIIVPDYTHLFNVNTVSDNCWNMDSTVVTQVPAAGTLIGVNTDVVVTVAPKCGPAATHTIRVCFPEPFISTTISATVDSACYPYTTTLTTTTLNGTPTYTVVWNGSDAVDALVVSPTETSRTHNVVVVTDAHGCQATDAIDLVVYHKPPVPNMVIVPNTSCAASNGSVRLVNTDPKYYYTLNGITWRGNLGARTFGLLPAGSYNLNIYNDITRCSNDTTIVVPDGTVIPTFSANEVNIQPRTNCVVPNGQIHINAQAGHLYFVMNANGDTISAADYNAMAEGEYIVRKYNFSTGCFTDMVINIPFNRPVFEYTLSHVNDMDCSNEIGTGSISVTPALAADYHIYNSLHEEITFTGLNPGVYTVEAYVAATQCAYSKTETVGTDYTYPEQVFTSTPNYNCYPTKNGTITAVDNQAHPNYTSLNYYLDGVAVNYPITGLNSGTYNVYAITNLHCSSNAENVVVVDSAFFARQYDIVPNSTCDITLSRPGNGQIHVLTPQGTHYLYVFTYIDTIHYNYNVDHFGPIDYTKFTLADGHYSINIKDMITGCEYTDTVFVPFIATPLFIDSIASTPDYSCRADLALGTITVSAHSSSASAVLTYSIDGGATYQMSNVFTGLVPGTYNIVIRNTANKCVYANLPKSVIDVADEMYVLTFDADTTPNQFCDPTRFNGSITVNNIVNANPYPTSYLFKINGGEYQTSNVFSELEAGTYVVTVKDVYTGCEYTATAIIRLDNNYAPLVGITSTGHNDGGEFHFCKNSDGMLFANVTPLLPGDNNFTYAWYNDCSAGEILSTADTCMILTDSVQCCTYTVEVANVLTGCKTIETRYVCVDSLPLVHFYINGVPWRTRDPNNYFNCENNPLTIGIDPTGLVSHDWTNGVITDAYEFTEQAFAISNYATKSYCVTIVDSNGCSSIEALNVISKPIFLSSETINACNTYTFHGAKIADSVMTFNPAVGAINTHVLVDTFTAMNGCDSIVTKIVTIFHSDTVNVDSTVCTSSLPIVWNGKIFTEAGTQTTTLQSVYGCDSVVVMTLHVSSCGPVIDSKSCPAAPTVTDHEGNVYATVQIGNQCWMRENLRTTTSPSTGTYLVNNEFTSGTSIAYTYTGKMARWYNNDSATYAPKNYGLLYNWNAAVDTFNTAYGETSVNTSFDNAVSVTFNGYRRGICPTGWHLPSDAEWVQLTNYVRSQSEYVCGDTNINIAKALADSVGWYSSTTTCAVGNNPSANNATGFGTLPAGYCISGFNSDSGSAHFWSSTQSSSYNAYDRNLHYSNAGVSCYNNGKDYGWSVRCLRDAGSSASLPAVTTNPVTSIDSNSAACGVEVISDGGAAVVARGVCWSTSQNPTIADNHTTDGTGTGSFTSNITGLTPNTTYYVRAYATNSMGTSYGNEVSFTTQPPFVCGTSTVADVDNNIYNTVQIGGQCWMKENLRTAHYADGTPVEGYVQGNNVSSVPAYGYSYNWIATMNGASFSDATPSGVQGICPNGWHVPSNAEWSQLVDYVSSHSQYWCGNDSRNIAKALADTAGWNVSTKTCAVGNDPSTNNVSGFCAMPAGYNGGVYNNNYSVGGFATFWSTTGYPEQTGVQAWYFKINYNDSMVVCDHYYNYIGDLFKHNFYYSARCIRNEIASQYFPTVSTSPVSNITSTTATCGGNVTAPEGVSVTARGVCWSLLPNPTITDKHTIVGSGAGSFTSNIDGLVSNRTYFVRAYATNSFGTVYGNEVSVTTAVYTNGDSLSCPGAPTLTDVDGNVYNTVQIGGQCWMRENLRTTKYADGTVIAEGSDTSSTIAFRYYPEGISSLKQSYGLLYNWPAVMHESSSSDATPSGVQGVCPTGWHVPSEAEWTLFDNYVRSQSQFRYVCDDYWYGDSIHYAKALAATEGWEISDFYANEPCIPGSYDQSSNNATGFGALPAGGMSGTYEYGTSYWLFGIRAILWSATEYSHNYSFVRDMDNINTILYYDEYDKSGAYSVRCLRDEGQSQYFPTVLTNVVSNITTSTALCGGSVSSEGSAAVTARGVCWSTSPHPNVANSHSTDGGGSGAFSSTIIGLMPNLTYYVRAYATNSYGTVYGNEVSFTIPVNSNGDALSCPGVPTLTDVDGNVYNTVKIGGQCWMRENLRTTKYSDGTTIPQGGSYQSTTAYWTYPKEDSIYKANYGLLYNWYAVMHGSSSSSAIPSNVQGVCPTGWHVPSDAEWTLLTNYVKSQSHYWCGNDSNHIAKALAASVGWYNSSDTCDIGYNQYVNNATGFGALPAGTLYYTNGLKLFGYYATFWSATENSSSDAYYRYLEAYYNNMYRGKYRKSNGFSVRCLSDVSFATSPTVQTSAVSNVTNNTASCGGNVTDDGGATVIERGVCWSTSPNPTVSGNHTTDGGGTGAFTSSITGLTPNTTYYVRAYATNSEGTAYGPEVSFTTIVIDSKSCPAAPTVTDHEGNVYATVQIGTQCWMRENLRTTTSPSTGTYLIPAAGTNYTYTGKQAFWYNNDSATYAPMNYGLLYNWNAAVDTFNTAYGETSVNTSSSNVVSVSFTGHRRGICPAGWHLPSDEEWTAMTYYVGSQSENTCSGGNSSTAKALASTDGWHTSSDVCEVGNNQASNNATGFSAVPAGRCTGSSFSLAGYDTYFWSSLQNESYNNYAYIRSLVYYSVSVSRVIEYKNYGLAVRCLCDNIGGDNTTQTQPTVSTSLATDITATSAILHGAVSNPDNVTITAQGLQWKASQDGTYTTVSVTGAAMSYNLTGLATNTDYTYRTFVTTAQGTIYGEEVSFTTLYSPAVIDSKSCPAAPTVADHEGNVYATVQIGSQCWMRDNLRTTTSPTTGTYLIPATGTTYTYTGKQARWYNNDSTTYAPMNYGLLYNWNAAVDTFNTAYGEISVNDYDYSVSVIFTGNRRGICPAGWHLPSDSEWAQLTTYVGSQSEYVCGDTNINIAKALAIDTLWYTNGNTCTVGNDVSSNNATGFGALPAGEYGFDYFMFGGYDAIFFWSSTQSSGGLAYDRSIYSSGADLERIATLKCSGFSVRCLRDAGITVVDEKSCTAAPTVTDHEGNVYATVQIGEQCWMRENLRSTIYSDGTSVPVSHGLSFVNYPICYIDTLANLPRYLYNWRAVMHGDTSSNTNPSNVQGICPIGWHVPSDEEWRQLTSYISGQSEYVCGNNNNYNAKALASSNGWENSNNNCAVGNEVTANNATGFSALPLGTFYGGNIGNLYYIGSGAYFWTATERDSTDAYNRYLAYGYAYVGRFSTGKQAGYSVRCLRDAATAVIDAKSCPAAPTVTDHEGNVYATVQIGTQCWMRDNLRTTTSPSTGTYLIPPAGTGYTYTGKQARWYNDDSTTYAPMNYGLLYNWNAAVDTLNTVYGETSVNTDYNNSVNVSFMGQRRGICPAGWHLPSDAEWTKMTNYVSGQGQYVCGISSTYIAKALASETGWNSYSGECYPGDQSVYTNNATGFSAVPAGYGFTAAGRGSYANFWSSSQYSSNMAYNHLLRYNSTDENRGRNSKVNGYSVRCIRDETASAVIDSKSCPAAPTVTDHEGNVYATVQIGSQCWMRDNLRTTTSPSTGTYLIPAVGTTSTFTGKQAFWRNNDSATYAPMNYGLLYNWNAAVDTFNTMYGETSVNTSSSNAVSVSFSGHRRGICPAGWHLPSDAEWTAMTNYVRSQSEYMCDSTANYIAKALTSTEGWYTSSNECAVGNGQASNNATGFSAVPAGTCAGSSFGNAGYSTNLWSSTQYNSSNAWYRYLYCDYAYVGRNYYGKANGFSVRCLRDEDSPEAPSVSALPYSTNFYDDDTWTLNNGTCVNYWAKSSAYGLFVTTDGTAPGYNESQASTVMAEKLLLMPSSDSVHIEFDVRMGGESSYDYLKVFLAPSSVTYTAGTSHNTQSDKSYSTYAVNFSNFKSQTTNSSYPYLFNLTNGNTIHISVNVANPNLDDTAKLVFLWRDDTTVGTQPGAIVSQLSVSEVPQHTISVSLTTDLYGSETTWQVKDISSNTVLASGGPYSDLSNSVTQIQNIPDIIVDGTGCYVFIINDSYGDGICCSYGNGSYSVSYDGTVMGSGGNAFSQVSHILNPSSNSCPAVEIALTSLDVNSSQFKNAYFTVSGVVTNNGVNPLTSFKVKYRVDGGAWTSDYTVSCNIVSGESSAFTHNVLKAIPTTGQHTLEVMVSEPNGVADNVTDNTLSMSLSVSELPSGDAQPCPGTPTVTDIDGHVYNTVQIGNQCWMASNLRTTRYADGTLIAQGSGSSATTAYRYVPDNNNNYLPTYGYFYNWTAVMHGASASSTNPSGVQGACPNGWHVPSNAEWNQLINYVASAGYACGINDITIAKALASTTDWNCSSVTCAIGNTPINNNSTGFGVFASGYYYYGTTYEMGAVSYLWSTTEDLDGYVISRGFSCDYSFSPQITNTLKQQGHPVRCLRD